MGNTLEPENPGRTKGAFETLISITYKEIAEWSGLSLATVRQYASRKQFDSRDINSVLQWCNVRRKANGLPSIGETTEIEDSPSDSPLIPTNPPTNHNGGYNPQKGGYDG